ncbi:type III secretion system HrpP C-terminal domain-containing protein [Pantoea agglomerans]
MRHGRKAACWPDIDDATAAPLGEVDARLSPFAAGWDISLRFAPPAMTMMAAHQERCRESLRRRMACAVRLRFEQRGGRE